MLVDLSRSDGTLRPDYYITIAMEPRMGEEGTFF